VRAHKKKIDRRLRSFIQGGIDDGSITPCDAKIAAFSIAGAVNWICMWYEPEGPLSPYEIATQFVRTLTQGLARKKRARPNGRERVLEGRKMNQVLQSGRLPVSNQE